MWWWLLPRPNSAFVDDDGKVYAYWGGCAAPCYIAELEDDMATIKEGTLVENPLGHSTCPWDPKDDGHISLVDAFFEASSPRKVMGNMPRKTATVGIMGF